MKPRKNDPAAFIVRTFAASWVAVSLVFAWVRPLRRGRPARWRLRFPLSARGLPLFGLRSSGLHSQRQFWGQLKRRESGYEVTLISSLAREVIDWQEVTNAGQESRVSGCLEQAQIGQRACVISAGCCVIRRTPRHPTPRYTDCAHSAKTDW